MIFSDIRGLTSEIGRLRFEIELDRQDRIKERYNSLDAAGIPSKYRMDAMLHGQQRQSISAADMAQFNQGAYDPLINMPQSQLNKLHSELQDAKAMNEKRLKIMLEECGNTHVAKAERDEAKANLDFAMTAQGVLREQNLRLAAQVNDLTLQLAAALNPPKPESEK